MYQTVNSFTGRYQTVNSFMGRYQTVNSFMGRYQTVNEFTGLRKGLPPVPLHEFDLCAHCGKIFTNRPENRDRRVETGDQIPTIARLPRT